VQHCILKSDRNKNHGWTVLEFNFGQLPGEVAERWFGRLHFFLSVKGTFGGKRGGNTFLHTIDETQDSKQVVVNWFSRVPHEGGTWSHLVTKWTELIGPMYTLEKSHRVPEAVGTYANLIGPRYFQRSPEDTGNRAAAATWFNVPWLALNPTSTDLTASDGDLTYIHPFPRAAPAGNGVEPTE
jgi:hypothetical protein